MIAANELRIGNWVKQLQTGRLDKIDLFMMGEIASDETYLDHLFPIPLTPEVLEKAGFVNPQGDYWQKDNELMLAFDSCWWWTNSWEPDGEFGFDTLAQYREIEHLHQLQNLYFSITNKELKITL